MADHTEGPWQSASLDYDPYTIVGGIDGPDEGRMHFTEVCIVNENAADAEANRKLIIAAPELLQAITKLRLTSRLLLQNAEGCAVNHYGVDFELLGLPGWLADCEAEIKRAEALIATLTVLQKEHA